eukprot:15434126-Alexandrium_andersonii.AAC.1
MAGRVRNCASGGHTGPPGNSEENDWSIGAGTKRWCSAGAELSTKAFAEVGLCPAIVLGSSAPLGRGCG